MMEGAPRYEYSYQMTCGWSVVVGMVVWKLLMLYYLCPVAAQSVVMVTPCWHCHGYHNFCCTIVGIMLNWHTHHCDLYNLGDVR